MSARSRLKEWAIVVAVVLGLGALILLLQRYNERTAAELASSQWVPRKEKITPEILLLRDYVRIDTSNPPGKEAAGAQWLVGQLRGAGVVPEVIESAPGRLNVYARLKGTTSGEGLLLLHHIDVVPADAKRWKHPPFAGEIHFNLMHARGTLDMKGIAICHLRAFLDVARSGKSPLRDIVFMATSDEEAGSELGMQWLLRSRPDLFKGIRYALNEGGITETKEEKISYFGIEVGTKQVVVAMLSAPAREPLQRARIALEPFFASQEPERISDEVRRFLKYIAPQRVENPWMLADVDRAIAQGRFWDIPAGYRELTQNIVWAEGVKPSSNGYSMQTYLVNLPDEDADQRIRWLERHVAPFGITVTVKRKDPTIPISSEFTPLFELLRREIRREYGEVSVGTEILNNVQNDSRFLRPSGITCYGIWPFPVDFYQTLGIHGVDERIRLDWFARGVDLTRRVVAAYAFEPGTWK
jgi:acetylornithine deacetylase/succinyl-diaminopimelate desuccinylase-like protein